MKYNEIIKLLDAGYTRDDIMGMNENKEPEPEPGKEPEMNNEFTELKEALNDLKKEIIASNIMNSSINGESEITGEDVIANIISPALMDKGGNNK